MLIVVMSPTKELTPWSVGMIGPQTGLTEGTWYSGITAAPNTGTPPEVTLSLSAVPSQALRNPKPSSPSPAHSVDDGGSQGESGAEFTYSTSDGPPKLPLALTRSRSNSIPTLIRDLNLDGTRHSPPRHPIVLKSRSSSLSTEHSPIQGQNLPPPTVLPHASLEAIRDRTIETSGRTLRQLALALTATHSVYRGETQGIFPL